MSMRGRGEHHKNTTANTTKRMKFLIPSCLIFNVTDKFTTYIGLTRGYHEANPLINNLTTYYGIGLGVLFSFLISLIGITLLSRVQNRKATLTLHAINTLYITATIVNVYILL